jgi:hypothetical protein
MRRALALGLVAALVLPCGEPGLAQLAQHPVGAVSAGHVGFAPAAGATLDSWSRGKATLQLGDRGNAVRRLQRRLTAHGWPVVIDGIFGRQTHRTVVAFQRANGLRPDGIVGPITHRALARPVRDVPPPPERYTHPNPDVDRWWDEALRAGWSADQWPVVACVMEHPVHKDTAESRGLPHVHNPRHPDDSYGLMQLNMRAHRSWVGPMVGWDFSRLFDGETNLRVARRLYDLAGGWGPWRSTWKRATCFEMEGQR